MSNVPKTITPPDTADQPEADSATLPAVANNNKPLIRADAPDPFHAYADVTARQDIVGDPTKFVRGDYLVGKEMALLAIGTVMTAHVREVRIGWQKWSDQRVVDSYIIRLADALKHPLPRREALGDLDEAAWEIDDSGRPKDCWGLVNFLPLLNDSGELFTFLTASFGGRKAIGELCRICALHWRHHPDLLPRIALDVDRYQHKKYGPMKSPKFVPAGWVPRKAFDDALAAAGYVVDPGETPSTAAANDNLDDDIVF